MPLMYSIRTGIRSRSSIKANNGTVHHEGEFVTTAELVAVCAISDMGNRDNINGYQT